MVVVAAVAVPYDRVGGVRYTMPLVFPCAVEHSSVAEIEPRGYGVTQNDRVFHDLVFADEGRVVFGQFRDDTQGQVDRRVAPANGLVGVDIGAFGPKGIGILTTQDIRQVLLADGVREMELVNRIHDDIDMEDGVARSFRCIRSYLYPVNEGRVAVEDLVAPESPLVHTSVYVYGGVVRIDNRQIHAVEVLDIALCVIYGIVVGAGGV